MSVKREGENEKYNELCLNMCVCYLPFDSCSVTLFPEVFTAYGDDSLPGLNDLGGSNSIVFFGVFLS